MNITSQASDFIGSVTTLQGLQEFNKAGLMSLLFSGAQITSAAIVLRSVPAQNCY